MPTLRFLAMLSFAKFSKETVWFGLMMDAFLGQHLTNVPSPPCSCVSLYILPDVVMSLCRRCVGTRVVQIQWEYSSNLFTGVDLTVFCVFLAVKSLTVNQVYLIENAECLTYSVQSQWELSRDAPIRIRSKFTENQYDLFQESN